MSLKLTSTLLACLLGAAAGCSCLCSSRHEASSSVDRRRVEAVSEDAIPLIAMDGVPLRCGIENLARYMHVNCILDPRVPGADLNTAGSSSAQPEVYIRWENFTAKQAFEALLDKYDLKMVTNSTPVARILPKKEEVRPISFRPSNLETNPVLSVLVMKGVPLYEAIQEIAAEARLNLMFDASLSVSPFALNGPVNFRWRDVTSVDALVALLDNYDLSLVEEAGKPYFRITFQPRANRVVKL